MASNEPTPQTDNNPEPNKISPPKKRSRFSGLNLPILSLIIATLALLGAIYSVQLNHFSSQQSQRFEEIIDDLRQKEQVNTSSIDSFKESINQSQAALKSQLQSLELHLQTAMKQGHYQKQDWLLLKARYYLELAQINAHWSNDQQTTIGLLQQADALVATIPGETLFPLRQAIAKEISQLQALPKLDIPGVLSRLDAAQNALRQLPIKHSTQSSPVEKVAEKSNSGETVWQDTLKTSMNTLQQLVVIRHNEDDIKPLISPLHLRLLRDAIQLNLEEAQLAVIQHNPALYQLALKKAINEIKGNFDVNADTTRALVEQLQGLQQVELSSPSVKLEESLTLLTQIIDKSTKSEGGKTP